MDRKYRINQAYAYLLSKGMVKDKKDVAVKMGYKSEKPSNIYSAFGGNEKYLTDDFLLRFNNAFGNIFDSHWLRGEGNEELRLAGHEEKPSRLSGVPFFADLPVTGGSVMQYNDIKEFSTASSFNLPFTRTAEFSFPVIGCSMQPTVKEGDIVGVSHIDGLESCNPDRIYLIITRDNERMIKRINKYDRENNCIWLVSDNPQYEPFPIYLDNIIDVYKVVWKISFETM